MINNTLKIFFHLMLLTHESHDISEEIFRNAFHTLLPPRPHHYPHPQALARSRLGKMLASLPLAQIRPSGSCLKDSITKLALCMLSIGRFRYSLPP